MSNTADRQCEQFASPRNSYRWHDCQHLQLAMTGLELVRITHVDDGSSEWWDAIAKEVPRG